MTDKSPRVFIAVATTRSEAVSRVLDLARDDLHAKIKGRVLIKPNFLSSVHHLSSTQAEAVRPLVKFLTDLTGVSVTIAEGGSRSTSQALDNFGYRTLMDEFGIEPVDLNHLTHSLSFEAVTVKGKTQTVEYTDIRSIADTIISVPVAKTHDTAMLTLSIKNMMGCLRRVHRPRMHGIAINNGIAGIAESFWNAIEDHPLVIKSFSGAVFFVVNSLRSRESKTDSAKKSGIVMQAGALAENLARMGEVLMPDIAVIDAFEAMEGDGPGSAGTAADMRIAVAGTDPVACDAVTASLMGFDPMTVGYLRLLHERGYGIADIDSIDIIGEDTLSIGRKLKPHRNYASQLRWRDALEMITDK